MKQQVFLLIFILTLFAGRAAGANPQGTLSANGPICATGEGMLIWTATEGVGPFTVVYNDGTAERTASGVVSGTPFNVYTTPVTSTTTYTLVSVTDSETNTRTGGFTGSSATITINALPAASAGGSQNICIDGTATVSGASYSNGTILWTENGAGSITSGATTLTPTYTAAPGDAGNAVLLTMTVTSNNVCNPSTATATYTVNVNPPPTLAGAIQEAPICSGATTKINLTGLLPGSISTISYTVNNVAKPAATGVAANASGEASFLTGALTTANNGKKLKITGITNTLTGCSAVFSTSTTIIVNSASIPTITGDDFSCVNSEGNVYTTDAGMSDYSWSFSGGGTYSGGTATENTITVEWTSPGPHTIGVNYTNTNGCIAASHTVKNVTVNALPVPSVSGPASVCVNSTGNIYTTQSGALSYTWSVPTGGTITSGGAGNMIVVTWNSVGNHSVLVNYEDANGCTAESYTSFPVTVNALPAPTISGPSTCRLTSTGNVYITQPGMKNYSWTISAGGTKTAGGTTTDNFVTVTWNTAGAQSVSVNYTNTGDCTALVDKTYNVIVNSLPSASNAAISGTAAIGYLLTGTYTYSDVSPEGISTYRWLRDGTTAIAGATGKTYVPTTDDLNKTITFEVTPVSTSGTPNSGEPVKSLATIKIEDLSELPLADEVCIEGIKAAGNILKGKYRYIHSKAEGASTYQWYRGTVPIAGATTTQYTLKQIEDIDSNADIIFKVTPVSSNIIPVTGATVASNPFAMIILPQDEYSVSINAVTLTANQPGGVFSGPGVTNGTFSPKGVGTTGSPYNIQYLLNIVNNSTSCSQMVYKTVEVVNSSTNFNSFKSVYCQEEDPDLISVTGIPEGSVIIGFSLTDADAIVSQSGNTVTVDPGKMKAGTRDTLYFSYINSGLTYIIPGPFVIDSVGTAMAYQGIKTEYCETDIPDEVMVTGVYPQGGKSTWTGSTILSDTLVSSPLLDPGAGTPGQTYYISYRYTSPKGCYRELSPIPVTINPLPNTAFALNPTCNIDGGALVLVPVQKGGSFTGDGVSGDRFFPDIAGLGEHTINYRIVDANGCSDYINQKTVVKQAQGIFNGIPSVICYKDTTFNVSVTGLPDGMTVNLFTNTRNSIVHADGTTTAGYSVPAAGEGLDTLFFSYKLEGVDYQITKIVDIDSIGKVGLKNLSAGDKICDNTSPFELFASLPGGVFTGPVSGNYLDPTKASGATSVTYKYTNSKTGCSVATTVPFNIIPAPQVSFIPADACITNRYDSTFFINNTTSSDSVVLWTWKFESGVVSNDHRKNPGYLYSTGGYHTVSLTATTINRCTVTKNSDIDLGVRPVADFYWKNDCYAPGKKIRLFDSTESNFPVISRTWDFNNGSLLSSDLNPEYTMPDTGYIQVRYIARTNYANCSDTVFRKIYLRPTFFVDQDNYYEQDFESGRGGWVKNDEDTLSSWQFGTPDREVINRAASGIKAWFTGYDTEKQAEESSSVISPCFDFSEIQRPMISLKSWKRFDRNRNGAALQYKAGDDDSWSYVGSLDDGINWYNSTLINGRPGGDKMGWTTETQDTGWIESRHDLDELAGKRDVMFRIAYGSDGNSINNEGIAFDDIMIGERTRKVLLEHFTNTTDGASNEAAALIDQIAHNNEKDVVNIQYHTNFPGMDPYYADNPGDAGSRVFFYGLTAVPYSFVDGGNDENNFAVIFDAPENIDSTVIRKRSLIYPRFTIAINKNITGGVLTVSAGLTALGNINSDNLTLYIAVTEKENEKGDIVSYNVFRKFIPDAGGIPLKNTWAKGDFVVVPEKTWVIENVSKSSDIEIVAFIQDANTKEILQTSSEFERDITVGIEDLHGGKENDFSIYPNPARKKFTVAFGEPLVNDSEITVYDASGTVISVFKAGSGSSEFTIENPGLKGGIYLLRITSGGLNARFKKLIITGD
ncbi:MAG TPA: T9SS type A sorting domain-containing protein [Bacteroidales bacterium]|nr:T9SS type A sorting domain-containing protein [Bacteroidales bacterium]